MTGETDLATMLATLQARTRPGEYVFVASAMEDAALAAVALAVIHEDEGPSYVLRREDADARSLPYDFAAAWLTLTVHSALAAVGLTAAVSAALAERDIPCNILAGFHHDHLLIAASRRDEALAALADLARRSQTK